MVTESAKLIHELAVETRKLLEKSKKPAGGVDVSQQVDWHGKMTAKAAWKLGYITREEFVAIRKAAKLRKILMEEVNHDA